MHLLFSIKMHNKSTSKDQKKKALVFFYNLSTSNYSIKKVIKGIKVKFMIIKKKVHKIHKRCNKGLNVDTIIFKIYINFF